MEWEKKFKILLYAAAGATLIAGILHLVKAPNPIDDNINVGILFLIGRIVQEFWIVPIIKKWGKTLYSIDIAGTIIFVLIWVTTRIPDNTITGKPKSLNTVTNRNITPFIISKYNLCLRGTT